MPPKDPLRVPPEDPLIVAPDSCPLPITTVPGQATRPPAETPRACRQRLRWVEAWVQPSSEDLGSSPSLGRARGGSHRLSLMGHSPAVAHQSQALTDGPLPGCVQASAGLVLSLLPNVEEKLGPQRSQPFPAASFLLPRNSDTWLPHRAQTLQLLKTIEALGS